MNSSEQNEEPVFKLKRIRKEGIGKALDKVDRYRLLNEPSEAESICRDVLEIDPDNASALVMLILTLTDQFTMNAAGREEAKALLSRIKEDYPRIYYEGIIYERQAKAVLDRANPGFQADAYEWLRDAMAAYEKAIPLSPPDNDEAVLRWNTCVRMIEKYRLHPRHEDREVQMLE